ncbi:hypothetical protein QQ045_029773 [Rhodiola kirilowii]
MDLRNYNRHLHFIHAIKKGTVVELMNQSPSGVPARKFRDMDDIYGDEDSFRDISLAGRNLRKKSSTSVTGSSEPGMKILFCSASDSTCNDPLSGDAACRTGSDDFSSDELTLRQLKEKIKKKGKKRKTPESDVGNEASHVGKEGSDSQPNEDDLDLLLPLRCLMSNLSSMRMVNVVENPDFLSQSENPVFVSNELVPPQSSCSQNEDGTNDSSYSPFTLMDVDPTIRDSPSKTAKSSQGSKMTHEEQACSIIQNQETECLDHQPVLKVSLEEDDMVAPYFDVCAYALPPSMDPASHEDDNYASQCTTNGMISQAGNDPVNHYRTSKTSIEAEIMANPGVVCQLVLQPCPSPMILLETNVQENTDMTPLRNACLHALSNSVDHISDEHGNSESHCIRNEMDSQGLNNPVKSFHHPERSTINTENENSPDHVKEDISMASLLDVPSDAPTSAGDHTSDNDNPVAPCNANEMTPNAQIDPVNKQIDDQHTTGTEYDASIMGECIHMVKEKIEVAKTSNQRDSLIESLEDDVSRSASSTLSCYSDSAVPANKSAQANERLSATSCAVTETSDSMTGSCDSTDKPFELVRHQRSRSCAPSERFSPGRKDLPPLLQKKLWQAMENIDSVDSREKLRSLGKLFAETQNKHKKPSTVRGKQMKGPEQGNKRDMTIISKHSETKSTDSDSANERSHSGIKMPRLPSSAARPTECIQSSPKGAIVFSKRQMQDFEALTKKLTKELMSMKEIIEERLNPETGTPDHNNDQAITAIQKASKAEAIARKWLSTMNRDCIRFCTIMEMNSNNNKDSESSSTIAQRTNRRKIRFADEAGGQLCQIKFIESEKVRAAADV